MTALNTIPTAAEDSALAPKKDTTTLRGLVAGVALAAFALGAVAATALRPTATRATTNFETAPLKPVAQKIFDAETNYFNEDPEVLKVPPNPAGYEVYGYNGCGYSLGSGHKQDIDTTFYLADDGSKDTDAVTKSIGKGRCEYFGHTNNPQPTWRTVGKHGVMKPPRSRSKLGQIISPVGISRTYLRSIATNTTCPKTRASSTCALEMPR